MAVSIAYNMDCMEYMRTLPDKAFDLAVVDPPYGCAITSQNVHVEIERGGADSAGGSSDTQKITRTGGSWSAKYGKK